MDSNFCPGTVGQDQKNITLIFDICYSRKRKGVYTRDVSENEEEEEELDESSDDLLQPVKKKMKKTRRTTTEKLREKANKLHTVNVQKGNHVSELQRSLKCTTRTCRNFDKWCYIKNDIHHTVLSNKLDA